MITLGLTRHTQLLQMLHEDLRREDLDIAKDNQNSLYLEADVVCEDRGAIPAAPALVVVSLAGVDFTQEEPGLATALLCVDVTGNREPKTRWISKEIEDTTGAYLESRTSWASATGASRSCLKFAYSGWL